MFHCEALSLDPGAGVAAGGGVPPPVNATGGIFAPVGGYVVCARVAADIAAASRHETNNGKPQCPRVRIAAPCGFLNLCNSPELSTGPLSGGTRSSQPRACIGSERSAQPRHQLNHARQEEPAPHETSHPEHGFAGTAFQPLPEGRV